MLQLCRYRSAGYLFEGTVMSLKEDIEDAIQEHNAWKAKFRDFLSGKLALDLSKVGETNCCKFGHWLEHNGCKLLQPKHYDEICTHHREFHHAAAEIARKIKQKDFAGARYDLTSEGAFTLASHTLTKHLLKASIFVPLKILPNESPAEETQLGEQTESMSPVTAPNAVQD